MSGITLLFECGHSYESAGREEGRPTCRECGGRLERVIAPKPKITISTIPWSKKFED